MKIGLMVGREYSFPPAFIERVNTLGRPHGITADFVKLAGTKFDWSDEGGYVKAGETLVDEKRRHKALVRADGTLALGPAIGSIHKIGALAQGLPACNGWTFWHAERAGQLVCVDDFRAKVRASL